jgi:predicted phage gp36 major capsid-like protein
MKIYKATVKRDNHTAGYTVHAEDEKEAQAKLFQICGEHNLKIKEL